MSTIIFFKFEDDFGKREKGIRRQVGVVNRMLQSRTVITERWIIGEVINGAVA